MLLAADVKNDLLAVAGWQEITTRNIFDYLLQFAQLGLQFFCTDINKDGRLAGPSFDLYKRLIMAFPEMKIIASGGVTEIEDIAMLEHEVNAVIKTLRENNLEIVAVHNHMLGDKPHMIFLHYLIAYSV